MKKELPVWSIVAGVGVAVLLVAVLFLKGGSGEASKDELIQIRSNQAKFGGQTASPGAAQPNPGAGTIVPPTGTDSGPARGASMDYSRNAPPGGFNAPN